MSSSKINLTHEHEEKIAIYCAQNNIDFNQGNAYDITLKTFKECPILYKESDPSTGEEKSHDITLRIARMIECQIKTVERIADKILLAKVKFEKEQCHKNIKKAKIDDSPNLEKLVENLYRLNIVDSNSYLALVCFLMQLKYTRDNDITGDDKSCVFFNGVARNGKSATAKAICDVETQFGLVFRAKSGKLLESTHEEQVWKSHLNYFDEVKPTDIDRELLLTIVNGGNVEINPKNKKQYDYHVNTNNIFTSNDQISLKQRRVSIVKFGDRLNGRPLENGALKKIITDIMVSLPNFSRYYDIYQKVSIYNENRINPLAIEAIITYMTEKLGFVNETEKRTLTATITFAPHDIYNCIKGTYNKQIISSERREAIKTSLKHFVEKGLVEEIKYEGCTTQNFRVTGVDYLKIMHEFNKLNTKDEKNLKISKTELCDLLLPFFNEPTPSDRKEDAAEKTVTFDIGKPFSFDSQTVKLIDDAVYRILNRQTKKAKTLSADTVKCGTVLYYTLLKNLQELKDDVQLGRIFFGNKEAIASTIQNSITEEMCKYLTFECVIEVLRNEIEAFDDSHEALLKDIYLKNTGITDSETFKMSEELKMSVVEKGHSDGFTIEDSWTFNHKEHLCEKEERKAQRRLAEQKKRELEKQGN